MPVESVVVHVDGASRGNPGPAGIGVVVSEPNGQVLHELSESIGHATNNVAEYTAWIKGLTLAASFGAREVTLHSDSELVIRQLKGEYRVKNNALKPLHAKVKELFQKFERVRVRQIPREENQDADRLASQAAKGDTEPEGRTTVEFD